MSWGSSEARVHVSLFATLREIVGQKTVDLQVGPGSTVQALAEELVLRWPELGEHLFDAEGRLGRRVNVFIDGRNLRWLPDREQTRLTSTECIDLFPPVAGG